MNVSFKAHLQDYDGYMMLDTETGVFKFGSDKCGCLPQTRRWNCRKHKMICADGYFFCKNMYFDLGDDGRFEINDSEEKYGMLYVYCKDELIVKYNLHTHEAKLRKERGIKKTYLGFLLMFYTP